MIRAVFSSLRGRLVALVFLAMLPALGMILWLITEERTYEGAIARENMLRMVRLTAANQNRLIENTQQLLITLAHVPETRGQDREKCRKLLEGLLKKFPYYEDVGVVEEDGSIFASAMSFRGNMGSMESDFFRRVQQKRTFAAGEYQKGKLAGNHTLGMGYPILDSSGRVQRIIFATLSVGWLTELAESIKLAEGSVFAMVDRQGTIIARYPNPEQWVGKSFSKIELGRIVLSSETDGTVETTGLDGKARLFAYAPLWGEGGELVSFVYVGLPVELVYANAEKALHFSLLALLSVEALTLAAVWFGSGYFIARHINPLVKATESLAAGNPDISSDTVPIIQTTPTELGKLAGAVGRAAKTVRHHTAIMRLTEEAMSQREAQMDHLLKQSPVVIYSCRATGDLGILSISDNVLALYGYKAMQFIGDPQFWSRCVHPDDLAQLSRELDQLPETGRHSYEYRFRNKDGNYRWIHDEMRLVRDEAGNAKEIVGSWMDVTSRHEAEVALAKHVQDLARSNAELEQFAYVASHDLQEPLRKILAFSDRLQRKRDQLGEDGNDYLQRMQGAAGRMQTLIQDLLSFSRLNKKNETFAPVNLAEVAKEVVSDLEVRIQQSGGRVEVSPLPTIDADPLQMRQLLQNLIGNALKYHKQNEPPLVKVSGALRVEQAQTENGSHGRLTRELCEIIVEDNGIGFDEKYLDRIFVPFQRLHGRNEYEGTGIGLAVCRKIAERHGGTITAKSALGNGSTFVVTLPTTHTETETHKPKEEIHL